MKKVKSILGWTAWCIWLIYVCGLGVAFFYFNWTYAKQNGFWDWILLGEVIATLKAFIWPYYLF